MRHRLSVASDGQARDVFSRCRRCAPSTGARGGVPRLINMLCHRALLAAFAAERRTVGLASMRKAYREVVTLPLPGRAPSKPRAAWAAGAVAVAAGMAGLLAGGFGVPPLLRTMTQGSALPVSAVVASAAPDPAPEEPVAAAAPDPMSTELGRDGRRRRAGARRRCGRRARGRRSVARDARRSRRRLRRRRIPPPRSRRGSRRSHRPPARVTALDVVLRAWQVPPLAAEEQATTADFTRIAERRGLEHLALTGNTAMLRLLDVPVVLELQLPGATGPRYAALISMRDGVPVLAVGDGAPATVEARAARACLVRTGVRPVARLRGSRAGDARRPLARRARQPPPGAAQDGSAPTRDRRAASSIPPTSAAVLDFQRSRYVSADGIVGRLTRVALYAAAGGYPRPTLTASSVGSAPAVASTGASS